MKNIFVLVLALTISFSGNLLAQSGKIKFDKTTHDFGTTKEEIKKDSDDIDGKLLIVSIK